MEVPDGSQRVSSGAVESSIYRGQESRMRRSIDRAYYISPNILSGKALYLSLGESKLFIAAYYSISQQIFCDR